MREEPWTEDVGAHLEFVGLIRDGAFGRSHDAGVYSSVRVSQYHSWYESLSGPKHTVGQDIEALLATLEILRRFGDGREVCQVDVEELQTAVG